MSKGRHPKLFLLWAIARYVLGRIPRFLLAPFRNPEHRQEEFFSEDEVTAKMMCIAGMGREASVGQFRLGKGRDTTLRVKRDDGKAFHEDPIYAEIDQTLGQFARRLTDDPQRVLMPARVPAALRHRGTAHRATVTRFRYDASGLRIASELRPLAFSSSAMPRTTSAGCFSTRATQLAQCIPSMPSWAVSMLAGAETVGSCE